MQTGSARTSRNGAVAAGALAVALVALAIDHLIGTETDPGEDGLAGDWAAFLAGAAVAVALTALLHFAVVSRAARREPERVAPRALALSVLAVLTLPLLFVAVPFPLAGSGVALGLHARTGERSRLGTAAVAVGAGVIAFAAVVYVAALVA